MAGYGLPSDINAILRLDKFALNAAIRLCARTERWQCAAAVLSIMRDELVEVDVVAITTVAAALSRTASKETVISGT